MDFGVAANSLLIASPALLRPTVLAIACAPLSSQQADTSLDSPLMYRRSRGGRGVIEGDWGGGEGQGPGTKS